MRNCLMTSAALLVLAAPATAATVVAYDTVNGASVAATETGAGVTGLDLVRGPGLSQNSGGTFNSRGWTETSLDDALAAGDFLTFGFTSTTVYDLTSLEIGYDRSNTGPMNIALQATIASPFFGSVMLPTLFFDNDIDVNGEENTLDFATNFGISFDFVSEVQFTLIGWGATSGAGTFDIEKNTVGPNDAFGIFISGEPIISAVPLPAGLPLLAGALGVFGLIRRKS